MRIAAHNRIDLTGKIFGHLTVVAYAGTTSKRKAAWTCICECGSTTKTIGTRLRSGHTTSCGCRQRQAGDANLQIGYEQNLTHGAVHTPTYRSWSAAKDRRLSRGIPMHPRWARSFPAFLEDMGDRPEGTGLGRIDTIKGYEPGNCAWLTPKERAAARDGCLNIGRPS